MLNIKIHVNICQMFLLPNENMTLQCRASSCTHVHQWKHAASVSSSNAALKPESRVQIFPLLGPSDALVSRCGLTVVCEVSATCCHRRVSQTGVFTPVHVSRRLSTRDFPLRISQQLPFLESSLVSHHFKEF